MKQAVVHTLGAFLTTFPAGFVIATGIAFLLLIVLTGGFFLGLRQRVASLGARLEAREKGDQRLAFEVEAQALLVRQMSMDLEDLRRRIGEAHEPGYTVPPLWATSDVPMNLNRRGQILRLSRKGKSVAEIAQDLNVAQGEVELLLKIHDLSQSSTSTERS
jgi:hypothetical protein